MCLVLVSCRDDDDVAYCFLVFRTMCSSMKDKDDLDFDEFLESVKARQQSMTTGKAHNIVNMRQSQYPGRLLPLATCTSCFVFNLLSHRCQCGPRQAAASCKGVRE